MGSRSPPSVFLKSHLGAVVPRIAAAGEAINLVGLGLFPIPPQEDGAGLVATLDRVAAGDAVLEDEEERGGEAVPLVRLSAAALHHQVLVVFQGAGAAQAKDEAQQKKQEHQNEERGHDCL